MPGDFSRKTFDATKHYSAVQKQQGRVDLDADWNEQNDISQHRTITETIDVIGASGVPKKGDSFKIVPKADLSDLLITQGHMYVGGLLVELEGKNVSYLTQPYYPNPDLTNIDTAGNAATGQMLPKLKDGNYLVYIDAWQREVNYLDDPLIQEVALGEADTATRLQNVWQVKLLSIADAAAKCKSSIAEWDQLIAPSSGLLNARTSKEIDTGNPCILPPSSGFRRLENQLYRVEIQKGGDLANTTFKWSRDNATVETIITEVNGSVITVADVGKDEVLGFAGGQWVEIVSEESTLNSTPHQLVKILSVNPAIRQISLSANVVGTGSLKLRRWDQSVASATADGLQASSTWIELEDGVQVFFSPGTYKAGDYWLIPARVATGEIEWPPYTIPLVTPTEQPAKGIKHAYCRLALLKVNAGAITELLDCRPKFPSLTEICAEDICFDNKNCNFPQAKNVQEALDILCTASDLREHNRLLHGTGVICGLKIKCRPARNGVIIEKGNALDCEGNMIRLKNQNGLPYDLVEKAKEKGLLDQSGGGQVCLTIARGTGTIPEISVEKYVSQGFFDTILEGSLLKDFFDGCIKNLFDFFKDQFSLPVKDVVPVPVSQRRLTAVFNLLSQMVFGKSAAFGFISGNEQGGEEKFGPTEDKLLREFYNDLKALLASETFCAMFDKDDPYPEYLLDDGLDTIFGTSLKQHDRLRLSLDGKFGYTSGNNNKVYVYNLVEQELVQSIDFPGDSSILLQDIVITDNGNKIVALGRLNDKDSVFATGKIKSNGFIEWAGSSTVNDSEFLTLGANEKGQLFSICKAKGLFEIRQIGKASFSITNITPFNATGLFVILPDGNVAVAAEQLPVSGTGGAQFHRLRIFNPAQSTGVIGSINLTGEDPENDIFLSGDIVFATGYNAAGQRVVGAYDIRNAGQSGNEVGIGSSSVLRLATYSGQKEDDYVLVTIAEQLKVVRILFNDGKLKLDDKFNIPVQPFPVAIVVHEKTNRGYVLNTMVNTLTAMNMAKVFQNSPAPDYTQVPPINLAIYRQDAIEAYKDVLSHILQYLKDCFCDKFLVDCPECGEDEKVYLGCVDIREGKVYNICNFSKRKYVKSFPTVGYWLSLVPVIPLVNYVFTKLCCKVFDIKEN